MGKKAQDRPSATRARPTTAPTVPAPSPRQRRKDLEALGLHTILVPIDFSEGSLEALRRAMALAGGLGASVVLLHALDPLSSAGRMDSPRLRRLKDEVRRDSERRLAALAKDQSPWGVPVQHFVEPGSPSSVITDFAVTCHADLIVLGSLGHTGLDRLLLGSVAERVVRYAKCSVLVVR
jgi:universal stress protein A